MSDRVCIIHVGTHKTATTSLQIFLAENAERLRTVSTIFPRSGWHGVLPGHHELAWELLASDRSPQLDALLEELRESDCATAILSSEDLSLLYARPHALRVLAEGIRAAGYTPKILLYVRAQGPYAESMYAERVKHDHVRPTGAYLAEILREGRYVPDGSSIHIEFRYSRLIEPFADVFGGANLCVRAYQSNREVSYAFSDFLGALGTLDPSFAATPVRLHIAHPTENKSLSFLDLLATAYTRLHPGATLPADPRKFIAAYAPDIPDEFINARFALFSHDEHLRLLRAFGADNVAIAHAYGVNVPFLHESDVPDSSSPLWVKAAIERAIYDRCLQRWMAGGD
jgi:hypothetical protein